jgi:hypothetical protein
VTRQLPARTWWRAGSLLVGLLGSTLLFYALRAAGLSLHVSLLVAAVLGALPTLVRLARGHRPRGVEAFFTVLLLAAVAVALLPGGGRFLLAKESLLTGTTGVWFLLSTRSARPLAYQFARPLTEGRLGWPAGWEPLWSAFPAFRRMWRRASLAWGVGTLVDAVARVVLVWTLPLDAVPASSLALFVATALLLNIGTTVYYARCGVFDRRGPYHRLPRLLDAG